ncbi:GFA family protein [Massilia antarctica]|uniref:GFA family protein n=1 Tax=Massilia antarctica TaxID=2765360 RepID=UPI0007C853C0|nr:GFA family protein [Massilia sp. H27-R4]MCY0914820.1 GFA family protein [Massilia sp. H27-R4]
MTQHTHAHLHGSCSCGTFSFETTQAPIGRFVCHCLFCQDFMGAAFSDVSVLKSHQIKMTGTDALIHKKYRLPPNLNRTRCAQCGKPAMETMGAGPMKVVFVPSKNFVEQYLLPPVKLHAFYNRRVADVGDDLPKFAHYWPSMFGISKTIIGF